MISGTSEIKDLARAEPGLGRIATMNTTNEGASSSEANSVSVTANDFLTLLVTEMKNQDPTANADPNEYINQLVQVNSLQQLIAINQTLADAVSVPNSDARVSSDDRPASVGATDLSHVAGNLSLPATDHPTARIATSLAIK